MTTERAGVLPRLEQRLNAAFWLALALVVAAYVVAFLVLRVIVPQPEVAGTLAAMVLGAGSSVKRAIEQRLPRGRLPVAPLAGHQRPGARRAGRPRGHRGPGLRIQLRGRRLGADLNPAEDGSRRWARGLRLQASRTSTRRPKRRPISASSSAS